MTLSLIATAPRRLMPTWDQGLDHQIGGIDPLYGSPQRLGARGAAEEQQTYRRGTNVPVSGSQR